MSGRPSDYTQEIATTICIRLADGESLRSICLDEGMPSKTTVFNWLLKPEYSAFLDQYTRARELQADSHVDELPDIADDGTNDYITKTNADGSEYEVVNSEHIQRSRLRIDTRKWIAERMRPKKYGNKITQEHVGEGGGPVVFQTVYEGKP